MVNVYEVFAEEAEVVVIGLSGRYDPALRDYDVADELDVRAFDSTFQAYRFLRDRAEGGAGCGAVLCDVDSLAREGYLFVHNLRRDPALAATPVIGIDREGQHYGTEVLAEGIDDVYVAPVSWTELTERIEQIREVRVALAEAGLEPATADEQPYRIPRGKRAFDIAFATCVILAISPLLLAIALAVKLTSRGPVLYKSKRVGCGYQEFEFLKFRSMDPDADQRVAELQAQNAYGADGAFFKMRNDPRVTRVGRVLRATSLDELPQLFNVLRGDMSIVGNRPLPLREAEVLTSEEWAERFLAPAGITGQWQTSGPRKDSMAVSERIALDIDYARRYDARLDLGILLRTVRAMRQESEA